MHTQQFTDRISPRVRMSHHSPLPHRVPDGQSIISRSERMQNLLAEAQLLASSDVSVLIQGESGSGKELLARLIHHSSPRAHAPFIAINCSAIPENLLESELFGHVRGAFSGATHTHPGLFEAANGGTLLLDEIGDMPLPLQAKLLRVLQERSVRAVGATRSRPVDVRILSATHCDLASARAEGRFREDLYYRIKVVGLRLPSLDERREDIPLLAEHFLQLIAGRDNRRPRSLSPRALRALCMADWPGNVRELQNVIEQLCALSTTPRITLAHVERALQGPSSTPLSYAEAKARFEHDYLTRLLHLTAGNVADAARLAQRNRTEFYRLLQRHQLDPEDFRTRSE